MNKLICDLFLHDFFLFLWTSVILGIFAVLMFVSTVYDLLVIQRQRHAAEHSQSEVLSDHIENLGENSPLLNSREKKSVPKQESKS